MVCWQKEVIFRWVIWWVNLRDVWRGLQLYISYDELHVWFHGALVLLPHFISESQDPLSRLRLRLLEIRSAMLEAAYIVSAPARASATSKTSVRSLDLSIALRVPANHGAPR